MKKIIFILLALSFSLQTHASILIEEWIEPAVDLQFANGTWKVFLAKDLPAPPIIINRVEGNNLLVRLRRIGLVWVGRSSVRLSEENLLLNCQKTDSTKATDYKSFGMRGELDNSSQPIALKCINNES
ncbi:hypothetical protein ACLKMH_01495 [Psychromonas sp. KJ10-10]|uniref:hypothetical protein n=1 Tax=Psychromonas sp. KJ10-10 TaxID=3391823 RepID=UPI0039B6214E